MSTSRSPSRHSPTLSQSSVTSSRSDGTVNALRKKCPNKIKSDDEARILWVEAKNTRASYQRLKTDKLLELEIILQSIQQTEDALGDADHFIGELYYLIKRSGLKPPQMSDEVEDTSYTHTIQSDDDRFSLKLKPTTMTVLSKPVTDIPNAAGRRPAPNKSRTPQRQGGQLKAKLATSKENLPPAAPAASSMRPVRAGAGKNMAMLIQHEKSGSDEDLSARKRKRNPREPATVLSTLTSGVPTNATENPMAPPKKKLKHRASEGQAGIVAPSTFDSSLMGAPLPTNLEPSSGQFNLIHSMSSGSNTQGSANGAAPNMTAQMSPTHMQPVTSGLSQQSPLVPTPNTIASQYSSNCYSTPASFNVNEHQDLSTNGFYNQHSTALSFNMNNASSFEEQPHFDNFFDGLSNQDHSSGMAMPSFDLEQDALPVSGKTDLMLPPVNPGTFGEEDSETEDDENQAGDDADQAGNDEGQAGDDEGQAGDDEGQAAGDEYSETGVYI
ncbi:hypothetical protein CPB83DRAFT_896797 [Crepidotus variabilis]|uniref:Uncharacterized protein n=1 Tax=Crepidotus variabilis TaxID=179855 RepID=A0A9P6EAG2_9AGAR|nr:hypothetical protein CPB83DRAFT_896797 [Crepidotus variabilis]